MNRESLKTFRVGVLMGGNSSEREISLKSGAAVLQSLKRSGYKAVGVDVGRDLAGRLRRQRIDVAFIALHGRWGEDGTVQGLLEIMGIPYTGPGVLGSSMAMDKAVMKIVFDGVGIPTPAYAVAEEGKDVAFPLPFVVKPANEGSTIGISIVRKNEEIAPAIADARKYDKKVIVEGYVEGDEITVGIVNGETLPVVQVKPVNGFYDFEAKYTKGMTEYIVPAEITEAVAERSSHIALKVYHAFDLSGCVRIDMLVKEDVPLVIDINTSPGMTETSLVPKAWGHLNRSFDDLVETILTGASLKI
ncbi:D-alanine--D-alanine ligase [Syntrophorhabdus aromaticivorans]|jgi:D-alanine-D-alanine ligase|uniref:D-alanine--D-alanine ligase n=1 Tax=Syntrophorhabdus aromaticivorans TaxID=328301 RepID=A0A971M778_9BACT|nr:D-alanine--D-alanine ligase [Syntrophorhabdus aromaticivorans]NLW36727.1 D-alanine--D-alanine ligase [Syntrophorhabdus aromaticivorans]